MSDCSAVRVSEFVRKRLGEPIYEIVHRVLRHSVHQSPVDQSTEPAQRGS